LGVDRIEAALVAVFDEIVPDAFGIIAGLVGGADQHDVAGVQHRVHAFDDGAGVFRGRPFAGRAGASCGVGIHRRSLTPIVVLRDGISVTLDWGGSKPGNVARVNTPPAGAGCAQLAGLNLGWRGNSSPLPALLRGEVGPRPTLRNVKEKRKGLQLALEPLNGQGIAGYVPEPEFWARRPEAPH